jgi:hypothetical protein
MVNLLTRYVEYVFTMRNRSMGAISERVRQVLDMRKVTFLVTLHPFGVCVLNFRWKKQTTKAPNTWRKKE